MEYKPVPDAQISLEYLAYIAKFLAEGGIQMTNLLGGEPTLHTNFREALDIVLRHLKHVNIVTNGIWNERARKAIRELPLHRAGLLINLNRPEVFGKKTYELFLKNLESIRGWPNVTFAINVDSHEYDYGYPLEMARRFQVTAFRWSLSYPAYPDQASYRFRVEDYQRTAAALADFLVTARTIGITSSSDCGNPTCIFTDEQMGRLYKYGIAPTLSHCGPILDVGIDLQVMHCFPLHTVFKKSLREFKNFLELQQYFEVNIGQLRYRHYPMHECDSCIHKELQTCQGGCLASSMLRNEVDQSCLSDLTDPAVFLERPARMNPRSVLRQSAGRWIIDLPYPKVTTSPMAMDAASKDLLDLTNGFRSLREAVKIFAVNKHIDETKALASVIPFLRQLILNHHLIVPSECRVPCGTQQAPDILTSSLIGHGARG